MAPHETELFYQFLAVSQLLTLSVCVLWMAGRIAARNMLGKAEPFNSIPYFWTVQYGKSLRYCGE